MDQGRNEETVYLPNDWLGIKEIKEYVKCGRPKAYKIMRDEKSHAIKSGNKFLIQRFNLDNYLRRNAYL